MIHVTADTNIYISALNFGGLPRDFLAAARRGLFRLDLSPPILREVQRVLRTKFAWSDNMLEAMTERLTRLASVVDPIEKIDGVPDDPDDNRILECAIEAGSHFIVSGDNHLLKLGVFRDIRILKVADFMAMLPTR